MNLQLHMPRLQTVLAAVIGTLAFWAVGLPLPFLFGPMAASLILALSGAKLRGFGQISAAARTILGVAVGTSITPAVIGQLPQMGLSLALVPFYIFIIGAVGVVFFRRICRFDPVTAYFAAMPGGLQDMILFGQEAGGNVRTLSLVHATRVLVIVTLAPIIATQFFDASLNNPIGVPAASLPWHELVIMGMTAIAGWKIAQRVGLFGASILGPMILATILSLCGVLHARPPAEAILAAQFIIGTSIGVHYVGVTVRELSSIVLAGGAFMVILSALAAIFAQVVTWMGTAPPLEAFLAFAPGGQAEMTVLSIVTGAELGFVIAHHLLRIVLVIIGAPIVARFMAPSKHRD
ncbi:MAG: AbrB family transcriptional regulator [Planktomarina sp.]